MTEHAPENAPDTAPPTKGSITEFIEELRRRRVIRVALVYLVAAWVIIQAAQTTFPALLLPDWTVTLVVILIAIGFPVAIILAWAYQVEAERSDASATSVHYVSPRSLSRQIRASTSGPTPMTESWRISSRFRTTSPARSSTWTITPRGRRNHGSSTVASSCRCNSRRLCGSISGLAAAIRSPSK